MPKMSSSQYPGEYLALYQMAAKETVEIPVSSKTEGYALRFKLHAFRKALEVEKDALFAITSGIEIRVLPKVLGDAENPEWFVVASPPDEQKEVMLLRRAGVLPEKLLDLRETKPAPSAEEVAEAHDVIEGLATSDTDFTDLLGGSND